MSVELNEYKISISGTIEVLEILEVRLSQIEKKEEIKDVLNRCTHMPRKVIEEAKMGYTDEFHKLLSTPPEGALLKLVKPECRLIDDCVMADRVNCSAKNKIKRGKIFPLCWEFGNSETVDVPLSPSGDVASQVIHAWKAGKYVIVTDD